jgi:hypothetical protein
MNKSLEQLENGTATEKVIVLKSIYKQGRLTLQPVFDPKTRWYLGVERLSEEDKKGLTYWVEPSSKIRLEEGTEFNLNDPIDKLNWQWVKHSPRIAASFEAAQRSKVALFYVHVEEDEAKSSVATTSLLFDALKYVMEDDPTDYVDRARLLGVDMKGSSPVVIKEYLLAEAKREPQIVVDAYTSNTVSLQLLFYKGLDAGFITSENGVYKYGSQILGVSIEASVAFMQASGNAALVKQLEIEINPAVASKEVHEKVTEKAEIKATTTTKPKAKRVTKAKEEKKLDPKTE